MNAELHEAVEALRAIAGLDDCDGNPSQVQTIDDARQVASAVLSTLAQMSYVDDFGDW